MSLEEPVGGNVFLFQGKARLINSTQKIRKAFSFSGTGSHVDQGHLGFLGLFYYLSAELAGLCAPCQVSVVLACARQTPNIRLQCTLP